MAILGKILKPRWTTIARDRRGVVAIVFALAAFVLLGFAGLVADLGYWYGTHGALQDAADAAAMAVARTFPYSFSTDQTTEQVIAQNAANAASTTLQTNPTVTISFTGNGASRTVTVVATAPEQLFFSEAVGHVLHYLNATAEAGESGTETACILGLQQNNPDSVFVNDTAAEINSPNCAVYSDGGMTNKNGTVITKLVGAVGSVTGITDPQTEVIQNGVYEADPYAGLAAPPTGTDYDNAYASTAIGPLGPSPAGGTCSQSTAYQISPGEYNGLDFAANSCINFQPGVYYINNGNFTLNGDTTLYGTGVTFYFGGSSPGTLAWNGNGNVVNMTAPTSGTYANMLVFQSSTTTLDTNTAVISGNSTFDLSGAIYFPQTGVYFDGNSTSGPTSVTIQPGVGVNIVAQTVEVGGNAIVNTGSPASNGTAVGGTPFLSG